MAYGFGRKQILANRPNQHGLWFGVKLMPAKRTGSTWTRAW